jgi:hypothetical protein
MTNIAKQLDSISRVKQTLSVKEMILIQKAFQGSDPNAIIKAGAMLQNLEERDKSPRKSLLVDPLDFNGAFGYKDKPYSLSYGTLARMARTPIINAIIKTRKNQIASFCQPQNDKYSTGFLIRRKPKIGQKTEVKTSKEDSRKIEWMTNFIMNCGENYSWAADDFDAFVRKITQDSLVYDQMTFEIVRNRKGIPIEFFATDASSYRLADSYDDDTYYQDVNEASFSRKKKIKGYFPSYVQVLQNKIEAEFYPWELCFGVRNPSTSLYNNGYGVSELEEMINVITSILYSDEYNRRFFSQGSAPKGILRVKGDVPESTLQQFRQQWQAMVTGVMNSWKTPILDSEVEWIDLQKSNRDMEFTKWMEYLIKIACGIYAIDANEIGFNISNSGNGGALFESNNEQKLKHSQDKGLTPLLKFIERKLNKYLISQIDDEFEFVFVGMEGNTPQMELEMDIKKGNSFLLINELREKYDEKPIEGGDVVSNAAFIQNQSAKRQEKMQKEQMAMQQRQQTVEQNPFQPDAGGNSGGEDNYGGGNGGGGEFDNNPFAKAFIDELNNINE